MGRTKKLLRVLRAEQEPALSQTKLARFAGIQRLRYWAIENGAIEPTFDEKTAVARVLGVKVADIEWPTREVAHA